MEKNSIPWSSRTPMLLIFLINQSYCDSSTCKEGLDRYGKAVTTLVNRAIENLILVNCSGIKIKNRCFITVIGYDEDINVLVSGWLQDLCETPLRVVSKTQKRLYEGSLADIERKEPYWCDVFPMIVDRKKIIKESQAFSYAEKLIDDWIKERPYHPTPTLIHITHDCVSAVEDYADADIVVDRISEQSNIYNVIWGVSENVILPSINETYLNECINHHLKNSTVVPERTITYLTMSGIIDNTHSLERKGFLYSNCINDVRNIVETLALDASLCANECTAAYWREINGYK